MSTLALLFLAACTVRNSNAYSSADVADQLNRDFLRQLQQVAPGVQFSKADCGDGVFIFADDPMGTCTVKADGVAIPVLVHYNGDEGVRFDLGDKQLIPMSVASEKTKQLLRAYGIYATVDCGPPAVRIIEKEGHISCRVRGTPRLSKIDVDLRSDGVKIHTPSGVRPIVDIPDAIFAAHKAGKSTIVDGILLERLVTRSMLTDDTMHIACPTHMDLSKNRRGSCRLTHDGTRGEVAVDAWIDDQSREIRAESVGGFISRPKVATLIVTDTNNRLRNAGLPVDASTICKGPAIEAMAENATFACDTTANGKRYATVVKVSRAGLVQWESHRKDAATGS